MITKQDCWFYEQTVDNSCLFPGTFKPHPLWLVQDKTIIIFYVHNGQPNTIQFDCINNAFEEPRRIDFSLLKVPTFDFSIQRVFVFQGRLLIVKNTVQSDKSLLLTTNVTFSKLYPLTIDLPCDFLHNGITMFESTIYFFGGISFDNLKCHSRIFKLDLCLLKLTEILVASPGLIPSPRCLSFVEVYNDDLFLASGHSTFPFYEGWKTADDAWFFNLNSLCWKNFNVKSMRLSNIKHVSRDSNRVCIVHKPKNYEVYVIDLKNYGTCHWTASNAAWVPPGVRSKVSNFVPIENGQDLDVRRLQKPKERAKTSDRRKQSLKQSIHCNAVPKESK